MLAFMILDFEIGDFRNEATSYNTSKMISIPYTATVERIYMIRIDGEKKKKFNEGDFSHVQPLIMGFT